jgi:transposase
MEKHDVVAVDIAKAVFQVAVSEEPGRVARERRLSRGEFLMFLAQTPRSTVVIEACGSAHHWGREIERLGHEVVLLPPHHVRPYVTRNKTDRTDAKGILEAYRNADIRPVPVRSLPQQVLGSMHRFRSGWISARTVQGEHPSSPAPRARHRDPHGHREGDSPGAMPRRRRRLRHP